jgi:hypothetical protein
MPAYVNPKEADVAGLDDPTEVSAVASKLN